MSLVPSPKAVAAHGHDVRVIMPLYQAMQTRDAVLTLIIPELAVPTGRPAQRRSLASRPAQKAGGLCVSIALPAPILIVPVSTPTAAWTIPTMPHGSSSFCHATLALLKHLRWTPFVVHCHDWQTALLPGVTALSAFAHPRPAHCSSHLYHSQSRLSGTLSSGRLSPHRLAGHILQPEGVEFFGQVNFMKAGLFYADHLTTVSPTYAEEIATPQNGVGLDGVLRVRRHVLSGILNGVDYDI